MRVDCEMCCCSFSHSVVDAVRGMSRLQLSFGACAVRACKFEGVEVDNGMLQHVASFTA